MSVFVIKLLAIGSMLIDHLGAYLRARLLISGDLYTVMRSNSRLANSKKTRTAAMNNPKRSAVNHSVLPGVGIGLTTSMITFSSLW